MVISPALPPHRRNHSSTSDDWQDGSVVEDFSDSIDGPSSSSTLQSISARLPDWDAWQTDTRAGPSSASDRNTAATPLSPASYALSQVDEDFFSALEKAGGQRSPAASRALPSVSASVSPRRIPHHTFTPPLTMEPPPQPPSPPIIDLRPEQRRIRQRQQANSGASGPTEEDDWFTAFEKDPLSKSPVKGRSQSTMDKEQMDSIREARDSPMVASPPQDGALPRSDYFGAGAETKQSKPAPHRPSQRGAQVNAGAHPSGSWWGSIRGLGSNLAQHAVDLIDPGVDFGDEELKIARKMGAIDISSKPGTPISSGSGTPIRGVTPVPLSANAQIASAQAARTTQPAPPRSATGPSSRFVSGAPGVDFGRLDSHWNTGSWSLDDGSSGSSNLGRNGNGGSVAAAVAAANKPRKPYRDPMPVHLTGRGDETNPVVTGMHSSHIQPYLPPRLKLGRTWRLLYSSDQDGVSLETLYHKVRIGMDPKRAGNSSSSPGYAAPRFDSDRQDGWLRGSSSAARAALGADLTSASASHSGIPHRIGGGLTSISDAGLVLAIRDADDQVFGAFVNESLKNTKGYYGNGDCFLWRTVQPRDGTPYIKAYPATLRNNYHVLSTHEYLSLGGGIDGRYGLWIDSSFEKGVSSRSETYGNEVLSDERDRAEPSGKDEDERAAKSAERERARGEVKFEPVIVEVWAVGID